MTPNSLQKLQNFKCWCIHTSLSRSRPEGRLSWRLQSFQAQVRIVTSNRQRLLPIPSQAAQPTKLGIQAQQPKKPISGQLHVILKPELHEKHLHDNLSRQLRTLPLCLMIAPCGIVRDVRQRPHHYSQPYHGAKEALAGNCARSTAVFDLNVKVNIRT